MQASTQVYCGEEAPKKIVWYAGTDTLVAGDAVCYDVAATVDATDRKKALGSQVIKPATANLLAFAGVVAEAPGKVGPCQVTIYTPKRGAFAKALVVTGTTAFVSVLTAADASYALAVHTHEETYLNVGFVALAAETNASGGNLVKLVMFV